MSCVVRRPRQRTSSSAGPSAVAGASPVPRVMELAEQVSNTEATNTFFARKAWIQASKSTSRRSPLSAASAPSVPRTSRARKFSDRPSGSW
ncbi:hypothetical protein D3C86_806810 [compost metagenome]